MLSHTLHDFHNTFNHQHIVISVSEHSPLRQSPGMLDAKLQLSLPAPPSTPHALALPNSHTFTHCSSPHTTERLTSLSANRIRAHSHKSRLHHVRDDSNRACSSIPPCTQITPLCTLHTRISHPDSLSTQTAPQTHELLRYHPRPNASERISDRPDSSRRA